MTKEETPRSVHDFLTILPTAPHVADITICSNSDEGEHFFNDFDGANIVGISVLRYGNFDVAAFITNDRRAITIVGKKGAFIAIEKRKGQNTKGKEMALAFRDYISHKRLNRPISFAVGEDITYQDDSLVPSTVIGIDPSSDFAQIVSKNRKGFKIHNVHPSSYTEDWFTLSQTNYESLILRADRGSILGAFSITESAIKPLQFGDNDIIKYSQLNQPPQGIVPSHIFPQE